MTRAATKNILIYIIFNFTKAFDFFKLKIIFKLINFNFNLTDFELKKIERFCEIKIKYKSKKICCCSRHLPYYKIPLS